MSKKVDAVVIGGGISGIVSAYALDQVGFRTEIIEKSTSIGGFGGSYQDPQGNLFDYGFHVIDYGRTTLVTRLFEKILDNNCSISDLSRGLVIQGELFDGNVELQQWPDSLKKKITDLQPVDSLGENPTRREVEKVYGKFLADVAYDEVIPSYPNLKWGLDQGASIDEYFVQAYPWFFPKLPRKEQRRSDEGYQYQDRIRQEQTKQRVIYPKNGGFGAFCETMVETFNPQQTHLHLGIQKIEYDLDQKKRKINSISVDGELIEADFYFWCAPLPIVYSLFGLPIVEGTPIETLLGSFAFQDELPTLFQEILIGDPEILINRINFPNNLRGEPNRTCQVEFSFPKGTHSHAEGIWKDSWLRTFTSLGLLTERNTCTSFDFKRLFKGFATVEPVDELIQTYRKLMEHPESNLHFPFHGVGSENLNKILPSCFRNVYQAVTPFLET